LLLDLWPLLTEEPTEEPPVLPAVGGYRTPPRILLSRPRPVLERRVGRTAGWSVTAGQVQGNNGRFGDATGDNTTTGSVIGAKHVLGATQGDTFSSGMARGVKVETAVNDEEFFILAML
jgi:hypothetical protein